MEIPVRSDVASGVDNQSGHRPEASRLLALLTSLPFGQSADSSQSARAPVEVAVERSAKRQAACGRTRKLIPDSGTDYISSRFLMLQELCIAELSDDQARAERPLSEAEARYFSHFSRVAVSNFRSLRGDIDFKSLSGRLSRAAKIPFRTRIRQAEMASPRIVDYRSVESRAERLPVPVAPG